MCKESILFNKLPPEIRNVPEMAKFKILLKEFLIELGPYNPTL